MKAIKALVVFMGILIVIALGFVIYGLMQAAGDLGDASQAPAGVSVPTTEGPAPPSPPGHPPHNMEDPPRLASGVGADQPVPTFGDLSLGEPAGSTIVSARVQARGSLVTVVVTDGGLPDRIVTMDLRSGTVIGRVFVSDAPSTVPDAAADPEAQ